MLKPLALMLALVTAPFAYEISGTIRVIEWRGDKTTAWPNNQGLVQVTLNGSQSVHPTIAPDDKTKNGFMSMLLTCYSQGIPVTITTIDDNPYSNIWRVQIGTY